MRYLERRPHGGMDRASVCNFPNATVVGSNPVQDARIFHPKNTTIRCDDMMMSPIICISGVA